MARKVVSRLTYANVMATIAVFAAIGGGAYAAVQTIPGPDGVIKGCYQAKKGSLRVVAANKRCLKSEKTLKWSQTGPKGATGPQGPKGDTGAAGAAGAAGADGAQGARGPSNAYGGSIAGPVAITLATTPGQQVGHINVPAGKYVITAKAYLENQSTAASTSASCSLVADGHVDNSLVKLESANGSTLAFRQAVSMSMVHEFASAGQIDVRCGTGGGITTNAEEISVWAVQVDTLAATALVTG